MHQECSLVYSIYSTVLSSGLNTLRAETDSSWVNLAV